VCCNGVCNARILSIASVPSSAGELLPPPPPAASDTAAGNDSWPRRRPAGRPRPPVRSTDWPTPVVLPAWGSAPATPALGWSTPPPTHHHHSDWGGGGGGGSRGSGNKSWLVNSDDGRGISKIILAFVTINVSVFESRKYSTWDVRDFRLSFFMVSAVPVTYIVVCSNGVSIQCNADSPDFELWPRTNPLHRSMLKNNKLEIIKILHFFNFNCLQLLVGLKSTAFHCIEENKTKIQNLEWNGMELIC
jgi:hypothetical protein